MLQLGVKPTTANVPLFLSQPKGVRSKMPGIRNSESGRFSKVGKIKAIDIDWTDPSTLSSIAGAIVGMAVGFSIPAFLVSRDERDEERLDEIRELNRRTFEATGEYLSKEELESIRPRRWTDKREFKDDD